MLKLNHFGGICYWEYKHEFAINSKRSYLIEVPLFAALTMRERPLWVATDSIPEFEQCFYIIGINRFWIAEHAWNVCCCKCYIFHRLTFPRDWVQPKEEAEGPRASLQSKGKSLFSPRRSCVSSLDHKNLTVLSLSFCHSFLVFSNYFLFVDFFRRTFNSPSSCVFQPAFFFKNVSSPCLSTQRRPHFKPPPPRAPWR